MNISGQVAIVTGGLSGLGAAAVDTLVERGASVVVLDLSGADHGGDRPARVHVVAGDVRSPESVQEAVEVAKGLGPVRIVVNSAGAGDAIKTVGRQQVPHPLDKFQRMIDINLVGTFNVIRLAAAHMATEEMNGEERGVIVNTASVAAFEGQIGQVAYSASKGGVVGMTLPLARDLSSFGIRVNTIAPGLFDTPLLATLPDDAKASLGRQVPHPARLGHPSEYGTLVAQIIENPMLNGETIRLDGAIRMSPR